MSIDEAEQAVHAAKDVAPQLPVVVMVTVDEDGNCLDGTSPETAAARLEAVGVNAIGCNCSSGPATVLSVIECMSKATSLPLIAMPNAGMPRNVEGRNIYLTSPEYMASFARKFVKAGASWVGGCCGTTPHHIRAMKSALRAMEAHGISPNVGSFRFPCNMSITDGFSESLVTMISVGAPDRYPTRASAISVTSFSSS